VTKREGIERVGEGFKHSSLKAATMAMKTGLLWVRTIRVGGLGQAGIGRQGLVKGLLWPPFLGGCGDFILVARQITANQRPDPGATVFVCKDWPDPADRFRVPLEPALHGGVLCKIQFVYVNKTLFLPILFTQGHESVVLQCGDERAILARDESKVLL
jgi:hypothetical protein